MMEEETVVVLMRGGLGDLDIWERRLDAIERTDVHVDGWKPADISSMRASMGLGSCSAVILSSSGEGPWQHEEIEQEDNEERALTDRFLQRR
jgi:hypothetical protein